MPDCVEGYGERVHVTFHISKIAKERLNHIVEYAPPHLSIQLLKIAPSNQLIKQRQEHSRQDRFTHSGKVVADLNYLF